MSKLTPATDWPIGSKIVLLDAYMRNPIEVKVVAHWNAEHIGGEDARGIAYYAKTDRIVGFAANGKPVSALDEFDDVLM